MRKKLIIAAILFQLAVLLFMCGQREYISLFGKAIYLRTAPVDPRDLFRGDYVTLKYEISDILPGKQKIDNYNTLKKGTALYTALKEHPGGLAELVYTADNKPDDMLFIKGFLQYGINFERNNFSTISVRYGIEQYFVQQGKGIEMEKRMGVRWADDNDPLQQPLEIRLAISGSGKAVIKGHRWCPLAHDISITWKDDNRRRRRRAAAATIVFQNRSKNNIGIIDMPDYGSFSIEPQDRSKDQWYNLNNKQENISPIDEYVIILRPGEKRYFKFDLLDSKLFFKSRKRRGEAIPIGEIENELFRIVYRPPSVEACKNLKRNDIIWHGYLPSRAFNSQGYID